MKESKNSYSVIFKPYITIAKVDAHHLKLIQTYLNMTHAKIRVKTKKESYHNDYYSLNIQNKDDINKVISLIQKNGFKSATKQKSFDKFVDCYMTIKEIGDYHHEWLDSFTEIIRKKLDINKDRANISDVRLSEKEWVLKIKEHLK